MRELPGDVERSVAYAINASGQVAGEATTSSGECAFLYLSEANTVSGILCGGGSASFAYGINGPGQLVGRSFTSGNPDRAFLYDASTHVACTLTSTGTCGGSPTSMFGGMDDVAYAVNDTG